jgi:hypothetical protein
MQSYNYSNLNKGKVFPQNFYYKINQEKNYSCQGSCCSCKYLDNRSNYDKIQDQMYQMTNSSIKLDPKIFPIMKPNYYNYNKNNKYTGV